MKIAVLGGSGQAGFRIARRCAHMPALAGGEILLLGRDTQRIAGAAADIAETNPPCAVSWSYADATDITSLRAAFLDCDLAVAAMDGAIDLDPLLRAALLTDTDLFDILPSTPQKTRFLQQHASAAVSKGLCFITDGGLLPGLPGTLVRFAAAQAPAPRRLEAFASFNMDWRRAVPSVEASRSFLEDALALTDAEIWQDGVWKKTNAYPQKDFGAPLGPRRCAAMTLQEIKELPLAFPSLEKAGFYMSGFSTLVDLCIMPPLLGLARRLPSQRDFFARLFIRALSQMTPKQDWFHLCVESDGGSGPVSLSLRSDDPYELTAIAACAVIDRYSLGFRPRGLWTQAAYVEPTAFFAFLKAEGLSLFSND